MTGSLITLLVHKTITPSTAFIYNYNMQYYNIWNAVVDKNPFLSMYYINKCMYHFVYACMPFAYLYI